MKRFTHSYSHDIDPAGRDALARNFAVLSPVLAASSSLFSLAPFHAPRSDYRHACVYISQCFEKGTNQMSFFSGGAQRHGLVLYVHMPTTSLSVTHTSYSPASTATTCICCTGIHGFPAYCRISPRTTGYGAQLGISLCRLPLGQVQSRDGLATRPPNACQCIHGCEAHEARGCNS